MRTKRACESGLRVSRTPEVLAWIVLQLLDELDETERAA
jgi:hypothetical protein